MTEIETGTLTNNYTDREGAHEPSNKETRSESLDEEASADPPDERQSKSQFERLTPTPTLPKSIRERLIGEVDSWEYAPPKGDMVKWIKFESLISSPGEIDTKCTDLDGEEGPGSGESTRTR